MAGCANLEARGADTLAMTSVAGERLGTGYVEMRAMDDEAPVSLTCRPVDQSVKTLGEVSVTRQASAASERGCAFRLSNAMGGRPDFSGRMAANAEVGLFVAVCAGEATALKGNTRMPAVPKLLAVP